MAGNSDYTFLPYLRRGISTQIDKVRSAQMGSRNLMPLELQLLKKGPDTEETITIKSNIELYGPGDITGFNPNIVIRTDPKANVGTYEPNFCPTIEFAEPDFPWRFSPYISEKKEGKGRGLNPWICLIVLRSQDSQTGPEKKEFEFHEPSEVNPIPSITILSASSLPSLDQAWAWAHVQVLDGGSFNPETFKTDLEAHPELFSSRLVCPRKLAPGMAYTAFVVPTFEVGRQAGLGEKVDPYKEVTFAWTEGAANIQLPVYYMWSFRTGNRGDFEYLVRLLRPQEISDKDGKIGKKVFSVNEPGFDLHLDLTGEKRAFDKFHLSAEGALVATDFEPSPKKVFNEFTDEGKVIGDNFKIFQLGNEAENGLIHLIKIQGNDGTVYEKQVKPPLYAVGQSSKHILRKDLSEYGDNIGWFTQLNLDPRHRIAAAYGTRAIQEHQEELMDAAWEQIGAVEEANQRIREAQLAKETSTRIYTKYFEKVKTNSPADFIALTSSIHRRVSCSIKGINNVAVALRGSTAANIAWSSAFRKVARPGGFMKRTGRPLYSNVPFKIQKKLIPSQLAFTNAFQNIYFLKPGNSPAEAPKISMDAIINDIDLWLNPNNNFGKALKNRIGTNDKDVQNYVEALQTIMAHPTFPKPMYEDLRDLSADYLLPGIENIKQNAICLLNTNQRFIEAYMLGLNHEMGRELLWREYPTDQRGTCFRQFWDVSCAPEGKDLLDIAPIHRWAALTNLGTHGRGMGPSEDLVLLIRGELLYKYPNTIIYAIPAKLGNGRVEPDFDAEAKFPVFRGTIPPDIAFLGFIGLTDRQAKGVEDPQNSDEAGWYFVLQEQLGEPRFGFDVESTIDPDVNGDTEIWNQLGWDCLLAHDADLDSMNQKHIDLINDVKIPEYITNTNIKWANSAADMAFILHQMPVRIAVHGEAMIPDLTNTNS